MTTCEICYDKKVNKIKKCMFCEFDCCVSCNLTYVLNRLEFPHCMSCKKEWNRKSMRNLFTQKSIDNEIKHHIEDILFEKEKITLPQLLVQLRQQKELEVNRELFRLNKLYSESVINSKVILINIEIESKKIKLVLDEKDKEEIRELERQRNQILNE